MLADLFIGVDGGNSVKKCSCSHGKCSARSVMSEILIVFPCLGGSGSTCDVFQKNLFFAFFIVCLFVEWGIHVACMNRMFPVQEYRSPYGSSHLC